MRPCRRLLTPLLVLVALLGALGVPARAQAQIAFSADLGAGEADGTSLTSLSFTTPNAAPAGASIVVVAVGQGFVPPLPVLVTCADGAGHTYATDAIMSVPNTQSSICS